MTKPLTDDEELGRPPMAPRPPMDVQIGVDLNLPFTTGYREAWQVLRDDDVTVSQLSAMRRVDGQVRALHRLVTLPIMSALRAGTFVPESGVEGGEEEAKFVEQALTLPVSAGGMKTPWRRVIAQHLLALFEGFAGFEQVFWAPEHGPLKGKVTLKKIAHRPAPTLTHLVSDQGEWAGFRQLAVFKGQTIDVFLPPQTCYYHAFGEEVRPFYGESMFRAAYEHYEAKHKLYFLAHLAAQRNAVGTKIGTRPRASDNVTRASFEKGLADLGVAQWMSLPEGWKVDILREGGSFDFLSLIQHHNSQMSKSVLAEFFDRNQGGDASLVDFGRQSDSMFVMMLKSIMDDISDTINTKVIPNLIDWNFQSSRYPTFVFGPMTDDQLKDVIDVFTKLSNAQTASPEFLLQQEKKISDNFGLEIDYETLEKRLEDQQKQAEQQRQSLLSSLSAPEQPPGGQPPPEGQPPATGQGGEAAPPASSLFEQSLPQAAPMDAQAVDQQMRAMALSVEDPDGLLPLVGLPINWKEWLHPRGQGGRFGKKFGAVPGDAPGALGRQSAPQAPQAPRARQRGLPPGAAGASLTEEAAARREQVWDLSGKGRSSRLNAPQAAPESLPQVEVPQELKDRAAALRSELPKTHEAWLSSVREEVEIPATEEDEFGFSSPGGIVQVVKYPTDEKGVLQPSQEIKDHLAKVQSLGKELHAAVLDVIAKDPEVKRHDDALQEAVAELARVRASGDANDEAAASRLSELNDTAFRSSRLKARREQQIVLGTLAALRPLGGDGHEAVTELPDALPDARERLVRAEGVYPSSWVNASSARGSLALSSMKDRAFYTELTENDLNGKNMGMLVMHAGVVNGVYSGGFQDYADEVNAHELGHRMENVVPGLAALEFAYVRSRTQGEEIKPLGELTGKAAYEGDEKAYKDEFGDAYVGKDYETHDPATSYWEAFQTGMQDLLGRRSRVRLGPADNSLEHFTLGALAALGGED